MSRLSSMTERRNELIVPSLPRLKLCLSRAPWTEVQGFNLSSQPRLKDKHRLYRVYAGSA
jgi:hypothetical protein